MLTAQWCLACLISILCLGLSSALSYGRWGWSLSHFTGFIETVVRRNMPLGTSIETYAEGLNRLQWSRRALLNMATLLDNGSSLAEAMARYPGMFPIAYRALVAAGERGGALATTLGSLKRQVDLDTSSERRAFLNSLYPTWLLLLMMVGPMPVFAYIMQSRLGIYLSGFLDYNMAGESIGLAGIIYPVLLATVVFLLILVLWKPLRSATHVLLPSLGRGLDSILWRTPLLGRFVRRRAAASYALAASRLLEGGIPQVEALSLAATASGSRIFAGPAMRVAERCGEGQPLHDALTAEFPKGWLPPDLLWYIRTGERSGQLPRALDQAAEACFTRAQTVLSRMVGLIFPIGVVLAGLNVGIMAYMVMGSIANMIMGYEL